MEACDAEVEGRPRRRRVGDGDGRAGAGLHLHGGRARRRGVGRAAGGHARRGHGVIAGSEIGERRGGGHVAMEPTGSGHGDGRLRSRGETRDRDGEASGRRRAGHREGEAGGLRGGDRGAAGVLALHRAVAREAGEGDRVHPGRQVLERVGRVAADDDSRTAVHAHRVAVRVGRRAGRLGRHHQGAGARAAGHREHHLRGPARRYGDGTRVRALEPAVVGETAQRDLGRSGGDAADVHRGARSDRLRVTVPDRERVAVGIGAVSGGPGRHGEGTGGGRRSLALDGEGDGDDGPRHHGDRARVGAGHRAVSRDAGETHQVIAGAEVRDRQRPLRGDGAGDVAVHRDGVAVGVGRYPRGGGGDAQPPGYRWRLSADDGERLARRLPRDHADRTGILPLHLAVRRHTTQRNPMRSRLEVGDRALCRRPDGAALHVVHRQGVAVLVRLGAARVGGDLQSPGGRLGEAAAVASAAGRIQGDGRREQEPAAREPGPAEL